MRKEYRVNGRDNYIIDYVQQSNGTYKIYAPFHPPDRHGAGVHDHHLYSSGEVCVAAGREPRSLGTAETIGKAWCEGWSEYCLTGKFPEN